MSNPLIARMIDAYGEPEVANPAGFLRELERALQMFVESELNLAADTVIRRRTYKTWPSIGDCSAACEAARASIRSRMEAQHVAAFQAKTRKRTWEELSPQEQAEARQFVDDCADGKIALGFCAVQLRRLAQNMRANRTKGLKLP